MTGAVFLSIFDWWTHSHGHSDIQLARAMAKRMPVLFVNSIGMRAPGAGAAPIRRITRKLKSVARPISFPDPALPLAVMTPLPLPIYSGRFEAAMTAIIAAQIKGAFGRVGLKDPMIIVTLPSFVGVASLLPHSSIIYYRSDRHSAFAGANPTKIRQYEDRLFSSADAVLYSSEPLFDREAIDLASRAHLVGHGTDTDSFRPDGVRAAELDDLPGPRAGFFGDIRERALDFGLIAAVAEICPDIQFVLGGPQLDDLALLKARPNITLIDACPHERMPERWRAIDVAILPYRRNDWTDAIEPIKLNEILATGLPAVGTPIPALQRRTDVIAVATGAEDFAAAIRRALTAKKPKSQKTVGVRQSLQVINTWDAIADKTLAIVDLATRR